MRLRQAVRKGSAQGSPGIGQELQGREERSPGAMHHAPAFWLFTSQKIYCFIKIKTDGLAVHSIFTQHTLKLTIASSDQLSNLSLRYIG